MMPKKLYRAVVEVLIEADDEAGSLDVVGQTLQRCLSDGSLLDWQYATTPEGVYGKPVLTSPDYAEHHFDDFTPK